MVKKSSNFPHELSLTNKKLNTVNTERPKNNIKFYSYVSKKM